MFTLRPRETMKRRARMRLFMLYVESARGNTRRCHHRCVGCPSFSSGSAGELVLVSTFYRGKSTRIFTKERKGGREGRKKSLEWRTVVESSSTLLLGVWQLPQRCLLCLEPYRRLIMERELRLNFLCNSERLTSLAVTRNKDSGKEKHTLSSLQLYSGCNE